MSNRNTTALSIGKMTRIGVLAALGVVLSLIEFSPLPGAPFYKLEASGVAIMLAGFSMGAPAGIVTLLIKDLIGLLVHTGGGWVGQLADFIALAAFMLPAALLYARNKSRKTALIGMAAGIAALTVASVLANLYILFPAFGIKNGGDYIVPFTIPFNLIKGAALTVITGLIYKPLSPLLHEKIR